MRDALLTSWTEVGEKIVKLAEEFPADQYAFRAAATTRTFAEQLRHVAFWNQYVAKTLRGESPDGSANELSADAYPDKSSLVPELRRSFADAARALGEIQGDARSQAGTLIPYIEHNGEHYGQLAVYYRLNGLVPPASR